MPACLHCGLELSPRAQACPQCGEPGPAAAPWRAGAPPPPPPPPSGPPPGPSSGSGTVESVMASVNRADPYAIASVVCAGANFVGAFFVGAVLAIVFGRIAQKNIREDPTLEGASLARAGIIIGWVGLGVGVAMLLLGITAFGVFTHAVGGGSSVRFP